MTPAMVLMQLLASQQGGGQQPAPQGGVPPQMPAPQAPAPQAQPNIAPGSVQPQQSPMMQQGMAAMNSPYGQTIPTGGVAPGVPQGQSPHPIIQAIIQALASGLQGYGYGSMRGDQQLESQQLAAQKAEAMGRMGIAQQELGLKGRQTDIEQERANTEKQGVTQTGAYQQGELGIRKGELGEQQKRTGIEQQRADQEHSAKMSELDQRAKQIEEEVRSHRAEEKLGGQRIGVEQQANQIAKDRIQMEAEHFERTAEIQGKQYTRQLAEDERKTLHASLDSYAKEHPWLMDVQGKGGGWLQDQHKQIDAQIDAKLGIGGGGGANAQHIYYNPDGSRANQGTRPMDNR